MSRARKTVFYTSRKQNKMQLSRAPFIEDCSAPRMNHILTKTSNMVQLDPIDYALSKLNKPLEVNTDDDTLDVSALISGNCVYGRARAMSSA